MQLRQGSSVETRKALVVSAFFVWAMCVSKLLLTDAEVGKDVVEDGAAGDIAARDFSKGADREAKDDWAT